MDMGRLAYWAFLIVDGHDWSARWIGRQGGEQSRSPHNTSKAITYWVVWCTCAWKTLCRWFALLVSSQQKRDDICNACLTSWDTTHSLNARPMFLIVVKAIFGAACHFVWANLMWAPFVAKAPPMILHWEIVQHSWRLKRWAMHMIVIVIHMKRNPGREQIQI